ncbi:RB-associated KRAB zinc finger protein-like [Scleropages formosus]|uniref:RB-associated KRAB zinc finger protein-like n=1 Tax=Scleropages formosus TaxID=113540 RepID=UPI000879015C|nr:RB-associated KRAB zinc finger protein-like [Scleropages formosus]
MLNCVAFRAQLSSVMGVLCQAAVAEVCKLVDEGSARLRTEVRKCRTENQELHRKLRIMEMELRSARQHALPGGASGVGTGAGGRVGRIAIGGVSRRSVSVGVQTTDPPRTVETGTESCAVAESCPTIEGVFGKEWCLGLWGDGDPPAVELEDTTVGHSSVVDQLPALIDSPSVKDEMFQKRKWSSDCKESLEMSGQSLDKFNDGPGEMPNHGKVATEEQPTAESAASECLEQQDIQVVTVGQKELDLQAMSVENMAEPNTHSEDSLRCVLAAEPSGAQQSSAGRGQKYFFCSICGKGFTYLSYFKVHQRRHSGEKPYSCTLCGKSFAQRTYLTLHQRTHTGEKPYCCADCGKCFTQKSSLNSHRRSHTGQKPYSCAECGKKYAYKHGLNLHQCSDRAWKNTS